MKLLFAGDTHGDILWTSCLFEIAARTEVDAIFQLGDFGYWEHQEEGVEFLDRTAHRIVETGIPVYWIDGNHENHPLLWSTYGNEGFVEVRKNLFYVARGHRWTWDGVRYLALGGATSIDREWRLTEEGRTGRYGTLWWETELITEDDVALACAGGETDVLLSHDCPTGVWVPWVGNGYERKSPESAKHNRLLLRQVVNATKPSLLLHGHYHRRVKDMLTLDDGHEVQVEGFASNLEGNIDSWNVMELVKDEKEET